MKRVAGWLVALAFLTQTQVGVSKVDARQDTQPKSKPESLNYVSAKAYYLMPGTHNNQSGYFSLSEGLDGNIHVGTAAYGENAFLVELDPRDESQRVVIDTNKVCGLTAKNYAAQAKIHTRNFVGPSGKVYVGSKQGYRMDENDKSEYPGGYVMAYDPRNGRTRNLGMPFKGQGVADVMVDESRGLSYVVTCERQHWMLGGLNGEKYRELGPILTPYAMTLIAADGCAYALTEDFELAKYDPELDRVFLRPLEIDGQRWKRVNNLSIPTWVLSSDRRSAYLLLLNDTRLLEIDLVADKPIVNHGEMIVGQNPDSRCGLDLGADGNVYAVIRIDNETGFGQGYLHHLVRYLTASETMEDLGVLKVENPDFFEWDKKDADGNPQEWIHGYHRLPDDTLTPLHAHMSLKVARDNTIYVTVIYPFTLLKIDGFQIEKPAKPAERYIDWVERFTRDTEADLPNYTVVAEQMADRHLKGGLIGFPFIAQPIAQDLWGRSGGLMHIGFDRPWKSDRTESEKNNDVAIVGYESAPSPNDLAILQQLKSRGVLIIGFGPSEMGTLKEVVSACDHWFDTDAGTDDRVVELENGKRAGHVNMVANAINGTTLIAELVGALTRRGKMPTMWKGYAYDDGRTWGEKYFRKFQFHEDFQVPELDKGELGRKYLTQIRYPLRRLYRQAELLRQAADLLSREIADGQTVYVAWQGHMPLAYVGKGDDRGWAKAVEFHPFLKQQVDAFTKNVPDEAMVLSLGYHGLDPVQAETWRQKRNRVIHLAGDHPDRNWKPGMGLVHRVDLGFCFGDACVSIDGYPVCLFAPSGVAQAVAYEAIQTEMAAR